MPSTECHWTIWHFSTVPVVRRRPIQSAISNQIVWTRYPAATQSYWWALWVHRSAASSDVSLLTKTRWTTSTHWNECRRTKVKRWNNQYILIKWNPPPNPCPLCLCSVWADLSRISIATRTAATMAQRVVAQKVVSFSFLIYRITGI